MGMWNPYRLRKAWDFTNVIQQKRKLFNSDFVIFCAPSDLVNCRFGIGIPKRLVKKATARNYYKRQIKNILILFLKANSCPIIQSQHYNLVVLIRPSFLTGDFLTKQKSLVQLINSLSQKKMSTLSQIKTARNSYD